MASVLLLFLSSCLKTRSEVGSQYQSQVYSKKQAENQSIEPVPSQKPIDERDELIRQMNGRIENLEYQVTALGQELTSLKQLQKEDPRILALQESVEKLENQSTHSAPSLAGAANENKAVEGSDKIKSSDENLGLKIDPKKLTAFDIAQEYFIKKDFKNAILEYQNFVEKHTKPQAKLLPEAKYKMGLCFEALGLKDEAKSFYEEVAAQYPNTEFGKKAKSKVNKKKN